jgi:hypothetical protein
VIEIEIGDAMVRVGPGRRAGFSRQDALPVEGDGMIIPPAGVRMLIATH